MRSSGVVAAYFVRSHGRGGNGADDGDVAGAVAAISPSVMGTAMEGAGRSDRRIGGQLALGLPAVEGEILALHSLFPTLQIWERGQSGIGGLLAAYFVVMVMHPVALFQVGSKFREFVG